MNKTWARLEERAVSEDANYYTLRGMATTPRVDRAGDIVVPTGARFERMPKLMLYHDSEKPVGNVSKATPTKRGIGFEALIPKVAESGVVRDRIEEAVHSVKYDLLSYVSIGFNPINGKYEAIDTGFRFDEWEWLELSLVTIPAQPDAVITGIKSLDDAILRDIQTVKSYDVGLRAALGRNTHKGVRLIGHSSPDASGAQDARQRGFVQLIPR